MAEGAVGPVPVVMRDVVGDEAFELASVPDEGAVEEFSSQRADPPFGERVRDRRPDRGLENLHVFGAEDLVKGIDELAAPVAHERFRRDTRCGWVCR